MEIRLAEAGDLPVILEIYRRARRFMAENGNPTQWGDGHPPRQLLEACESIVGGEGETPTPPNGTPK